MSLPDSFSSCEWYRALGKIPKETGNEDNHRGKRSLIYDLPGSTDGRFYKYREQNYTVSLLILQFRWPWHRTWTDRAEIAFVQTGKAMIRWLMNLSVKVYHFLLRCEKWPNLDQMRFEFLTFDQFAGPKSLEKWRNTFNNCKTKYLLDVLQRNSIKEFIKWLHYMSGTKIRTTVSLVCRP